MASRDPARYMMALCVLVVLFGVLELGSGLLLHWGHRSVDSGLDFDYELLDRIGSSKVTCSGLNIETYIRDTLEYHQSLQKLFRLTANGFLKSGALFIFLGAMQLWVLRKVRQAPHAGDGRLR